MLGADDLAAIEGDAEAIYRQAGADPGDVSMKELCARLLGAPPDFARIRSEGVLAWINDQPRVFVRAGTPAARARWIAGHELAHWWFDRIGYRGLDIETRCDALGAALVAPRKKVLAAWRLAGDEPGALAEALRTTQSLALLRLGEVRGTPVALVKRPTAIVRGEPWWWPGSHEQLARLAKLPPLPGTRKVRITDEPLRVGIVVDDVTRDVA